MPTKTELFSGQFTPVCHLAESRWLHFLALECHKGHTPTQLKRLAWDPVRHDLTEVVAIEKAVRGFEVRSWLVVEGGFTGALAVNPHNHDSYAGYGFTSGEVPHQAELVLLRYLARTPLVMGFHELFRYLSSDEEGERTKELLKGLEFDQSLYVAVVLHYLQQLTITPDQEILNKNLAQDRVAPPLSRRRRSRSHVTLRGKPIPGIWDSTQQS